MAEGVAWVEVEAEVGWGRLRGKTCVVGGAGQVTYRMVALHGWLDNANSFDTLVPLLPTGVEVLTLDLPGHGHSDHLPLGAHYNPLSYAMNVRTAVLSLGWTKFILMGHSMGSCVANYFAAMFPDMVIALISLDFLRPFHTETRVERMGAYADDFMKLEQFEAGGGTVYSESKAIERLVNARVMGSEELNIDQEAAQILLPRCTRRVEGGYVWSHDPKARVNFLTVFGGRNWVETVSAIHCPVLVVAASNGVVVLHESYYRAVLEAYTKNSAMFVREYVKGAHHVHLTHPERVAPAVRAFIGRLFVPRQRYNAAKL